MTINYSNYILNPTEFINIPVMEIIELYKKIEERGWEKLNSREKDFSVYFNSLWSEYKYMTEELNRDYNAIKGRLEWILKKIISGERFTPIYILEKPSDSKKRTVKLDCLVKEFLDKWQVGNHIQIPESDFTEPIFDDW